MERLGGEGHFSPNSAEAVEAQALPKPEQSAPAVETPVEQSDTELLAANIAQVAPEPEATETPVAQEPVAITKAIIDGPADDISSLEQQLNEHISLNIEHEQ